MTFYSIDEFTNAIGEFKIVRRYVQLSMAFDIETSSFYQNNHKCAIMYVWQFAIENNVLIGRTWQEFLQLLNSLYDYFNLNKNYIIIYVHNLGYEFQFMRKWLAWKKVFANELRKPIYAETVKHTIFRCSYLLSGYSLTTLAKNIGSVKKLDGYLSYEQIRHSKTPLTKKEIEYCVNDVLIITEYIKQMIHKWQTVQNIPLTQTGNIRRYTRNECFKDYRYKWQMRKLTIEPLEFLYLKQAFTGGFAHCNANYVNVTLNNVTSYDINSSYPSVIISEKYPASKGRQVYVKNEVEYKKIINTYCVIADVTFYNLREKMCVQDNIISLSKMYSRTNDALTNNGRIVKISRASMTITEIDYKDIITFYDYDAMIINKCYCYEKRYLPKPIIKTVLELYKQKTELKDVQDKESEYLHAKELLNSVYGMCVTNTIKGDIVYKNDTWSQGELNLYDSVKKYNDDKSRFLFYAWGIYITSYARNRLFNAILECGRDYVYSDTDSVKILNGKKHARYFNTANDEYTRRAINALNFYGIDKKYLSPKNIKGDVKPLGIWKNEGTYSRFKSLGAKRYMYKIDNDIYITVAGLSKSKGKEFIKKRKYPFLFFNETMKIDSKHSGRLAHTYCDYEISGSVIDRNGQLGNYCEKSFVHLSETEYNMALATNFIEYYGAKQRQL